MFEVIVDALVYIQGVPVELTEAAVSEGGLRAGEVVGLMVAPLADQSAKVLVEVRLSEEGQQELIKPGLTIQLGGEGGVFRIGSDWRRYLPRPCECADCANSKLGERCPRRPDPGGF